MSEEEKNGETNGEKAGEPVRLFITGNTYEVKDALKDFGCTWDRANKRWVAEVPADGVERATSIFEGLGVKAYREGDAPAEKPAAKGAASKKAGARKGQGPSGPRVTVGGKTYPVKQDIKDLGFRWDRDSKQWWKAATPEEANELRSQIERLGPELRVGYIDEEAASAE